MAYHGFSQANNMHQERTYRNLVHPEALMAFRVVVKETDLLVYAEKDLHAEAREQVLKHRGYVEAYIRDHPGFRAALSPWHLDGPAPNIVREMVTAGEKAGVGPMAAIAGAIAESVGKELLIHSNQVIVENGGDVFIKTARPATVAIFAGKSPLSMRVGIRLPCGQTPVAVCTSSGTVGHSLSLGKADAVCVVSDSCALADAAATALGNLVRSKTDIESAIAAGKNIGAIRGIAIIIGEKMGVWGQLEVIPLGGKNS